MRDEQTVVVERRRGGRAETLTVRIPSNERLVAAALELQADSGGTRGTCRVYGDRCVGRYLPPRPYTVTQVNPFTGEQGESQRRELGEDCTFFHYDGDLTAVALVFFATTPPTVRLLGKPVSTGQMNLLGAGEPEHRAEGAPQIVQQTRYERDPRLRAACLAHHGAVCAVCGMTFEAVYGDAAAGYIHVHHLVPLADVGREHVVDPVRDLVPVCANCHSVIHLRTPPFAPLEVKAMLKGLLGRE